MHVNARSMHIGKDISFTYHRGHVGTIANPTGMLNSLETLLRYLVGWQDRWHLSGMTVLIDAEAMAELGMPVKPPTPRQAPGHPQLNPLRANGWRVSMLSKWTTVTREEAPFAGTAVHLGFLPWMGGAKGWPLLSPEDPAQTLYRVGLWHERTGSPYRTKAGITGNEMLRAAGHRVTPFWKPDWSKITPANELTEMPFNDWRPATAPAGRWVHSYDGNGSYLAAAINAEVSVGPLRHTGPRAFDEGTAGYWLVEIPHWNLSDVMPHPMGIGDVWTPGMTKWVTTPTLRLVQELADNYDGIITPPAVLDSWTGEKTRRVLRKWGSDIRDHIAYFADEVEIPSDSVVLVREAQQIYKETTNGLWFKSTSSVHRPDWAHTGIAVARSNAYRKMMKAGMVYNRWPNRVHAVDEVEYASDSEDPGTGVPPTIAIRPGLGGFKCKSTEGVVAA